MLTWFASIHGNNIHINGAPRLEELVNLLKHLIATLSRHQIDDLGDGKRGTSKWPFYTFLHWKIHNKECGLHSEKYCQWLINKASQTNKLLNIMCQFFRNRIIRSENLRSYNSKTHVIRTNVIVPWQFQLHEFYVYNKLDLNTQVT